MIDKIDKFVEKHIVVVFIVFAIVMITLFALSGLAVFGG